LSARRYFVERTFQDAKSELGWAESAARKYRAWEHHPALTAAALWFVAQTKLEWESEYGRDTETQVEVKSAARRGDVETVGGEEEASRHVLSRHVLSRHVLI
jgi:hypothetical protein